jgi:WD40 repeat protein
MSRDGTAVAVARVDYPKMPVEVWDTETGKATSLSEPTEKIVGLELSDDGKLLAVIPEKGDIEVWDLTTNKKSRTFEIDPEVRKKYASNFENYPERFEGKRAVAFSPDGKQLATSVGWRVIAVCPLK